MKNKKFFKRMTAAVMAAVMTASNLCFPEITNTLSNLHIPNIATYLRTDSDVAHAAIDYTTVNKQETIGTLKELYEFSNKYANNVDGYQDGIWRLYITTAEALVLKEDNVFNVGEENEETLSYIPLGTDEKPFRGVIYVTRSVGNDLVLTEDVPFFNCVYDSVEILRTGSTDALQVNISRQNSVSSSDNQPLFARKVVHDSGSSPDTWNSGSSAATWKIFSTGSSDFSGLIGELGSYASVNIELNNTCSGNILSDGSAGLICGRMGDNSVINASIVVGSRANYSVASGNGSAGGLVGEMGEGSLLNFTIPTDSQNNNEPTFNLSEARTISAATYAGGLVGKNNGGFVDVRKVSGSHQETITSGTDPETGEPITETVTVTDYANVTYTAKGSVSASTGAGGIFGYYKATDDTDLTGRYAVGVKATDDEAAIPCYVQATYAGGYVGQFDGGAYSTVFDGTADSRLNVTVSSTGGSQYFGGLVGRYSSSDLTKKFEAKYIDIDIASSSFAGSSAYGGVIGAIGSTESDSAAYILVDNITVNSTDGYDKASSFGGIVGDAGEKGSLIDCGSVAITTGGAFSGGGIVGKLSKGVLRLSGITNLYGAECGSASTSNGQIVGERGDALVYALGTGENTTAVYGNGWGFVRSENDANADDIGTWGEVVRISSIEDSSTGIVVYDSTNHTVTVNDAVPSITNVRDFVKTALNMQLNNGGLGALQFTDTTNTSTNLLKNKNLTISGSIELDGTGITGFMRDGDSATTVGAFTGKLTGSSSASVKLAIGERYGLVSADNNSKVFRDEASTTAEAGIGRGAIFAHKYYGLFSRTGDSAEISNVKICGFMNLNLVNDDCYVGGAVAVVTSGLALSGVDAEETINYKHIGGDNNYIGGLIGLVSADNPANKNITIGKTSATISIKPTIKVTGSLVTNDTTDNKQCIGGVIGAVLSTNAFTVSVSDATLTAKIDASTATGCNNVGTAGLICDFAYKGAGANDDTRTLNITNVTSNGTEIKNPAVNTSGAILGYRWFNTNVNFSNVALNTTVNELDTTAKYVGGLVYKATGHWTIPSSGLAINALKITKAPTSLGIIVHDGHYTPSSGSASGLFLELTAADSYTFSTSQTIPAPTGTYDELCAYLSKDSSTILKNGTSGIISYHTKAVGTVAAGTFSMDGTNCNSYKNIYNTSKVNPNSRYYYNLDGTNRTNPSADNWKLLSWSVNRYAASNIKKHFANKFSQTNADDLITGTFDMVNISYYPIDIGTNVDLGDITVKFYNSAIEGTETNGKSSLSATQHYLMHYALFKNVTSTIDASGNIHLKGNVGNDAAYTGALICGTLSGTLKTNKSKEVVLEGITLNDNDGFLLINSINSATDKTQANLYLYGVRVGENGKSPAEDTYSSANCTSGVASSLIGVITGYNITLDFEKIKLDARKDSTYDGNYYGTDKSIFTHATLIDTIDIDANSVAKYYYKYDEDWGSSAPHKVTYGQEINDSIKNSGKQRRYYATGTETKHYTRPDNDPSNSTYDVAYADFSTNYLPYVKNFNNNLTTYERTIHELDVNVMIEGLIEGCGTYNHPYILRNADQIDALYKLLNGTGDVTNLRLPVTLASAADDWCDGEDSDCVVYLKNGSNYEATGHATWEVDQAREYVAGAYFRVEENITISSSSFGGLGSVNGDDKYKYAFRGVIVGKNENVTITNNTKSPFIKVANGCVVRNLTVAVNTSDEVVDNGNTTTSQFTYGLGSIFYGGVIGEIMGGDNIIDNVHLSYTNNSGKSLKINSTNGYLSTVGGYVGVVVNGGLIFRNMTASKFTTKESFVVADGSNLNCAKESDTKHLYINPYVGRVINGYAINETTSYSGDTNIYTLDNGTKNYRIPDINSGSSAKKITFGTYDGKDTIDIQDGQSLFILSLITQSGAGTAPTASGDYAYAVSYDGDTAYWTSSGVRSAAQNAATHLANYSSVGNAATADKTNTSSDYYLSKSDTTGSKQALPYIIYKYTQGTTGDNVTTYRARSITYPDNKFIMRLTTENGTYNLPDSFRGIGSICTLHGGDSANSTRATGTTGDEDGKYSLHLYGFEGNSSTININLDYKTYCNDLDNYIKTVYGINTSGNNGSGNINTGIHIGFGLFNYVQQVLNTSTPTYNLNTGYYIGNFTLSGIVSVKEYKTNGDLQSADSTNSNGTNRVRTRHPVGGVTGGMLANDYLNLYKLNLENMSVSGISMVGGYVGKSNFTGRDGKNGAGRMKFYANCCNTTNLEVSAKGGYCSGMTAGYAMGFLDIYINTAPNSGDFAGSDGYSKSSMEVSISNTTNCIETGTGGIIGSGRTGLNEIWINNVTLSGMPGKAYVQNTDTTANDTRGVGGFIGYARKAGTIIITNSTVKNIDIMGPSVGGVFGFIENQTKSPEWGVNPYIRIYNCKVINDETDEEGNSVEHIIEGKSSAGGITGSFQTSKGSGDSQQWDSTGNGTADKYVLGYDEDSSATKTKYKYDIEGCVVSGYTIAQTSNADSNYGVGGLIGYATNANRTIVNSSVYNCTIKVERSSTKHYMGGIVGYTGNAISGYNIASYNNTFGYTTDGTVSATTYGNFIGNANSKAVKIVGFTRKNNTRLGNLVTADYGGTNSGGYIIDSDYTSTFLSDAPNTIPATINDLPYTNNSKTISFVGEGAAKNYYPYVNVNPVTDLSRTTTAASLTGDGSSLYTRYTKQRAIDEHGNYIMDGGNYTYVTENGEPVYQGKDMPIAQAIIDDIYRGTANEDTEVKEAINAKYSAFRSGDDTKVALMLSNALPENNVDSEKDLKLTTYGTEMSLPTGIDDFPVIAIDGSISETSTADYTDYITSYIRLMTNSNFDYTADTAQYRIKIYACRFVGGRYQIVEEDENGNAVTAGLNLANNKYTMTAANADTIQPNNQISLIDIQFYNPANAPTYNSGNTGTLKTSGEVAMHLYVPVLTKRMVRFNFYSSLMQGTDYVSSSYAFPHHMAGNFDSWFTMYLKYEYPVAQVDAILETGRGLKWNSDKVIHIAYDGYQDLADSTQFVLLDNNNGEDKEYYMNKTSVTTDGGGTTLATDIIELNSFTSRRTGTAFGTAQTFRPQNLYNFVGNTIRYELDNDKGKYEEVLNESDCTVKAYDSSGNLKYFRQSQGSGNKYTLTATTPISETYYISVYTYSKDNDLVKDSTTNSSYGFKITCPLTLNGTLTSKRSNKIESYGFLGELFEQTLDYSDMNPVTLITPSNHEIYTKLTSTVSFIKNANEAYNQNMLNQYGIKLYQGFLVYLNRYDSNGRPLSDNKIYGSPSYTYTNQVGNGETLSYSDALNDEATYLYIPPSEAINIPAYVEGVTWGSTQTATAHFEFSDDKDELETEFFPIRYDSNSVSGIGFHATANIEYSQNRVEYSNQTFPKDDAKRYHMEKQESAELTLTALDQSTDDGYDEYGFNSKNRSSLGINAKYIDTGENYETEGDYEHIDISVNFDTSNLPEETILNGSYSLYYTLKLEQKQDANTSKGYTYVPVSIDSLDTSYLKKDSLKLYTKGADLIRLPDSTENEYYYKIDLPLDRTQWETDYSEGQFTARLSFDVKTAAELEKLSGYLYSNYRISMTANIVKTNDINTVYAGDEDCVVWTNAKINPNFVTPNSSTDQNINPGENP